MGSEEMDVIFDEAVKLVVSTQKASASLLQLRLQLGYARSARLLDDMEQMGVVGIANGAKPRDVLIKSMDEFRALRIARDASYEKKVQFIDEDLKWNMIPTDKLENTNLASFGKVVRESDGLQLLVGSVKGKNLVVKINQSGNLISVGPDYTLAHKLFDSMISGVLIGYKPEKVRLIVIDETMNLAYLNRLPHLLTPVIFDNDKSLSALKWTIGEAEHRKKIMNQVGAPDIESYNRTAGFTSLPYIIVFCQLSSGSMFYSDEVIDNLERLITLSRQCGIYLVMNTDFIPPKKVNQTLFTLIPNKIFFKLTKSQAISYEGEGADKLTGPEKAILFSPFNQPFYFDEISGIDKDINTIIEFGKKDLQGDR